MKRIFNKLVLFLMLTALCLGSFAGCAGGGYNSEAGYKADVDYNGTLLPDYSQSDKEFDFFAYRAMIDGTYTIDGVGYAPTEEYKDNFLTPKAYQTYKEAGFNMLMVTGANAYRGDEGWEGSPCQTAMEMAYQAGIEKIIIKDQRLTSLVGLPVEDVVGDNGMYADQAALTAEVKTWMQEYYNEPGFYGFVLGDEPAVTAAKSYGVVYKAMKAAAKELGNDNIYIHINFLPITTDLSKFTLSTDTGTETFEELYTRYIEEFLKETEADRIAVDIYIFRDSGIYPGSYANVQILRELADKYNADLSFCLQSFEMWNGSRPNYSKVDKTMMRMELELMIGMGMDDFAYYTYSPDQYSETDGTKTVDTSAFLDYNGQPTEIYTFGQKVMQEAKAFEKVVLNYEFKGSNMYTAPVGKFNLAPYLSSDTPRDNNSVITYKKGYQFALIKDFAKDFTFDNDVAFVTELYDQANDLYMYMIQNSIDPRNGALGDTHANVSVNFGTEYKYIAEFDGGHLTYRFLNNGTYTRTLSAGQAVFVIPLK